MFENKLADKHKTAIKNLLICKSITEAAKRTGIDRSKLYRWMKLPEFKEEYDKQKKKFLADKFLNWKQSYK